MAKSARASTKKANNQRLKAKVFGPVEAARAERLSARLLELAAQPKPPKPDAEMNMVDGEEDDTKVDEKVTLEKKDDTKPSASKRIEKRKTVSKIVFPKYGERHAKTRRKH